MSTAQILEELPNLKAAERLAILQRLSELDIGDEIEPSPEMAAAIESGLRSAETEPNYTIEEVRAKARAWVRKSS
jgi:hypothetical protein